MVQPMGGSHGRSHADAGHPRPSEHPPYGYGPRHGMGSEPMGRSGSAGRDYDRGYGPPGHLGPQQRWHEGRAGMHERGMPDMHDRGHSRLPPQLCRQFRSRGACDRGPSCQFLHELPPDMHGAHSRGGPMGRDDRMGPHGGWGARAGAGPRPYDGHMAGPRPPMLPHDGYPQHYPPHGHMPYGRDEAGRHFQQQVPGQPYPRHEGPDPWQHAHMQQPPHQPGPDGSYYGMPPGELPASGGLYAGHAGPWHGMAPSPGSALPPPPPAAAGPAAAGPAAGALTWPQPAGTPGAAEPIVSYMAHVAAVQVSGSTSATGPSRTQQSTGSPPPPLPPDDSSAAAPWHAPWQGAQPMQLPQHGTTPGVPAAGSNAAGPVPPPPPVAQQTANASGSQAAVTGTAASTSAATPPHAPPPPPPPVAPSATPTAAAAAAAEEGELPDASPPRPPKDVTAASVAAALSGGLLKTKTPPKLSAPRKTPPPVLKGPNLALGLPAHLSAPATAPGNAAGPAQLAAPAAPAAAAPPAPSAPAPAPAAAPMPAKPRLEPAAATPAAADTPGALQPVEAGRAAALAIAARLVKKGQVAPLIVPLPPGHPAAQAVVGTSKPAAAPAAAAAMQAAARPPSAAGSTPALPAAAVAGGAEPSRGRSSSQDWRSRSRSRSRGRSYSRSRDRSYSRSRSRGGTGYRRSPRSRRRSYSRSRSRSRSWDARGRHGWDGRGSRDGRDGGRDVRSPRSVGRRSRSPLSPPLGRGSPRSLGRRSRSPPAARHDREWDWGRDARRDRDAKRDREADGPASPRRRRSRSRSRSRGRRSSGRYRSSDDAGEDGRGRSGRRDRTGPYSGCSPDILHAPAAPAHDMHAFDERPQQGLGYEDEDGVYNGGYDAFAGGRGGRSARVSGRVWNGTAVK